jgi:hypothetical protein
MPEESTNTHSLDRGYVGSRFLIPPTWVASSMVERDKLIYP